MKRVFILLLATLSLYAYQYNAKFYIGLGGGVQYENFSNYNAKSSPAYSSLTFGYGDDKAYSIEAILNYIDNKANIFSNNDGKRFGFDIMFVKAFVFRSYFHPFVKAGFGVGRMSVTRKIESRLSYSSYNLAAGGYFPIAKNNFNIEINYMYRYNSYQAVDLIATKENLKSHINQIYFGINYRF